MAKRKRKAAGAERRHLEMARTEIEGATAGAGRAAAAQCPSGFLSRRSYRSAGGPGGRGGACRAAGGGGAGGGGRAVDSWLLVGAGEMGVSGGPVGYAGRGGGGG